MNKLNKILIAVAGFACLIAIEGQPRKTFGAMKSAAGADAKKPGATFQLKTTDGLEVQNIQESGVEPVKSRIEAASYRGRRAVRIVNDVGRRADGTPAGGQAIAILKSSDFKDGTIELEIAGMPREGAPADVRGFVGIAFRVQDHGSRFECFYLRMTNGRADDQLQRNHSVQYVSEPDFSWKRLRTENPGVYESYTDLEVGVWTKVKIVVAGTKAKLYVGDAAQPCLIVNDLKLGDSRGQIALWTGSDSDGYFSNLTVK